MTHTRTFLLGSVALAILHLAVGGSAWGDGADKSSGGSSPAGQRSHLSGRVRCVGRMAAEFPCRRIDLSSHLALSDLGGGTGNDIWGWTDPASGKEYALVGRSSGTSFVDISDPEAPIYVGNLPTESRDSVWRDIKVYENHAFIVSEARGHGMQIFDLTQLGDVADEEMPVTFGATARYRGFGRAHNIAINEDSGYAYAMLAREDREDCRGGLHAIDISDPVRPVFAGCFSAAAESHDAHCVNYSGPDRDHRAKEICFGSNERRFAVVDVTDKDLPQLLSTQSYDGRSYSHQGWLTEDHRYFLLDDELDEVNFGHNTRTYIWDVRDLDSPRLIGSHDAVTAAIDHNQYVKGQYTYQANYRAGVRVLKLDRVSEGILEEIAYFDLYEEDDLAQFNGAWSVYPYFSGRTVVANSIEGGLFVLRVNLPRPPVLSTSVKALTTDTVVCHDQTLRERIRLDLDGSQSWSCRTEAFALPTGNRLRQIITGRATGANATATVSGVTARRRECFNLTTGVVAKEESTRRRVSCVDLGVPVKAGDQIRLTSWSTIR